MLIEHDMGITKEMARTLILDTHPCCACKYPAYSDDELIYGLGLIRFSDACVRRHPDIMERAYFAEGDGAPDGDWHRLDTRVYRELRKEGVAIRQKGRTNHYKHGAVVGPGWQDGVRLPNVTFTEVEAY